MYNYAELKSELQGTKADEWHSVVGNYIMKKNKHNEEEKKKLEEKYEQTTKGWSIIVINVCIMREYLELKTKVADNEFYTAKLMKEKEQLQERVTSLEEQSIKETSSIGVQFNYLIPSMGKSIIV